jgi:aminocarboxymuconate-semialdehyde decarboxylase
VRNYALDQESRADPEEGFGRLYFDSIVFDSGALRLLLEKAGPEHVMLGSDYPFPIGDLTPQRVVREALLGKAEANQILEKNARRIFLLKERFENGDG